MRHTKVIIGPEEKLEHLLSWSVFLDASASAMCGKSPWPGQWLEAPEEREERLLCIGCMNVVRNVSARNR